MWRIWFILQLICLYWMCEVVFSSVLHRRSAHRSLRVDEAVSWWVYTCPTINTTPKKSSEGLTKQTKERKRTGKHTESGHFTAHYFKTHEGNSNESPKTRNPTSLGTSFCHLTSLLPGQVGWTRGPSWHHNSCCSLPVTPALAWHINPAPESRASTRHITQ